LSLALIASSLSYQITSDEEIFQQFQTFMTEFKKSYSTIEEFKERFEIFKQNYVKLDLTNSYLSKADGTSYDMGITQFFDLTPEEFSKTYLNLNIETLDRLKASKATHLKPHYRLGEAPESWDWREKGAVTPVKNQGSCGSCWAFSAIGNIESRYIIKNNKTLEFSEQQLVDCDKVDQGCNGGLMEDAFKYLENQGLMSEQDYTYTGRSGQCKFDSSKVQTKVTGFNFAPQNESQIKQLLYENGPFAIAINATPLQFYFGGIFNPWFEWICNPKGLNHGVLLVGYGVENGKSYWIVKNSWGSYWGEHGYFRLIAGKGACGVDQYVISAELDN